MDIFSVGYTSTMLIADVAEGAQATFASVAPILAVVVGLILTFVVARYIVGLFKTAGKK
jgi:uncharacterized membrane-anchored protein YhcB (DUF1043 family)